MKAFRMTVDQAELFFEICQELNATTEEQRVAILTAMSKEGHIDGIVETKMGKEEYIRHLSKQFGSVLRVSDKSDLIGDTNDKPNASIGFNTSSPHNSGPEHYCTECRRD